MSLLEKEPVKRVKQALEEFNKSLKIITLDISARTAIEAASSLDCDVGAIIKSLVFKTEKSFILCLIAGDKKASLKKMKKLLKFKDVSMASAEDVKKITGYTIGGVSPVGHSSKMNVYIDKTLERYTNLFAAAGHPNCVFKISFLNLQKITNGSIIDIIE